MFKKLRNKFLILNMTIISIVMVSAFFAIYLTTYNGIRMENQNKLNSTSMGTMILNSASEDGPGFNAQEIEMSSPPLRDAEQGGIQIHNYQSVSSDYSLSFHVTVDSDGQLLAINSIIDMSEEAYQEAAATAWNNPDDDTVTIEGKKWKYAIDKTNSTNVIMDNGQMLSVSEDNYQIKFLDITDSSHTLLKLLTTLLIIGFIMLFVIFFISLYFANRVIKPISEVWEKQKQFIADASHELKTPLSIIKANYDVLLENQEESVRSQLKWFGYMKVGMDRMTRLINDLLSLARVEDTSLIIQKGMFNMSDTVHDTILSMEAAIIEKDIHLSLLIAPDVMILCSSEDVMQIIAILLDNAIKYTNNSGKIEVSLTKLRHQVEFTIKNSGKGIPKQDLPKIYNRFYRADPSRTSDNGSYGLGLSIAKSMIDRLGGRMLVTSEENEYTTFSFTLKI